MNTNDHKRKYFEIIKPIADELKEAGFRIDRNDFTKIKAKDGTIVDMKTVGMSVKDDDLQYLSSKYNPLPQTAVEILLKWIPKVSYDAVQEVLISQLAKVKVKYNGNILLNVYKNSDSNLVKERIGFVLEESKPEVDLDKLEKLLIDSKGSECSTLILAGIKLLPQERINPILIKKFDSNRLICLSGLKKTGEKEELKFLKEILNQSTLNKKEQGAVKKTIEHIKKNI